MNRLRSLESWDRGFEYHSRHGCLCVLLFCVYVVLCVGRGLATGWSPVQGVLPTVYRIKKLKNGQCPTKGCRAIDEWMNLYHVKEMNICVCYLCEMAFKVILDITFNSMQDWKIYGREQDKFVCRMLRLLSGSYSNASSDFSICKASRP
jgi:hypothetical protein